jgi:predicted dehydrogenase
MEKLTLAIIGCGAQTRLHHLPVLAHCERIKVTALADKALPLARELAGQYNVPMATDDYRRVFDTAEAALVVLPHHLHAPVTVDLLENRLHVLLEKPMALRTSECDRMIQAAERSGTVLAIGLDFRFFNFTRFLKSVFDTGLLGKIDRFEMREGHIPDWPLASDYLLRREMGGGVLADVGAHVLDLLLWWLGDYEKFEYCDDSQGGVEANCELSLQLKSGTAGVVELSRTRFLKNTWVFRGEKGTLEAGFFQPIVRLQLKDQPLVLSGEVLHGGDGHDNFLAAFRRQFDDFVDAVRQARSPFVSGTEGRRAVQLIEACYSNRHPLAYPWMTGELQSAPAMSNLRS